jgi:5-formyltetrahydrofolate cyclo-ligase
VRESPVSSPADFTAGLGRPLRSTSRPPLYQQVRDRLEALVLAIPLGDDSPLPAEGQLATELGVSRGTLRRATEELARQGMLRIEPGRGTFLEPAAQVRRLVRDRLLAVARPDSRFDLDLNCFVPDFEGRERCDRQLVTLPEYEGARTVFVAPDNSLEDLRHRALAEGKRLLVPTYAMRRGFVLLDGRTIPSADHALAATLDGMERCGPRLDLDELRAVGTVDLVLTGAVAVTRQGVHFGGGHGFVDLEWALLRQCGLATPRTPVAVSVHGCQVLEVDIRPGPHDVVADVVVTPETTHRVEAALPKPAGIVWDEIPVDQDQAGPYISALLAERAARFLSERAASEGIPS